MGRPSELFESTPNSGGYYETQESYYQDGQRDTLTLPWTPVITYNVNALGEVTAVSAASGQNPATSATYNAAGQLLSLTYGSGDGAGYGYDPKTGRMSQYQFTLNGQTDTGTLGWNADSTLASLDITDDISGSGDTQSCTYTHDDLGRIATVTCGSLWQQTFSLDAFGNLQKSGSLVWQANYPSGNRASLDAYDGDGDVTSDGANTYAWDTDGKMVTVSGAQATYDALGRLVQESINSDLRFYYAPDGAIGGEDNACCGVRMQFAALPGGAEAIYDCCNLYYFRQADWLGSERLAAWTNRTLVSDQAYAPYGEAYDASGGWEDRSFTGQQENLVRGVYDFPFRECSPAQGRWLSPDPAGLAAVNPANPQTWNAYAYVANQPPEFTDPLGLNTNFGDCTASAAGVVTCSSGPTISVGATMPPDLALDLWQFLTEMYWSNNCDCINTEEMSRVRLVLPPVDRPNFGAAIDAADRAGRIFGQVALQTNFLTKPWFYVEWWSAAGAAASGALLAAAGGAEAVWGGVRALGPLVLGSAPAVAQGIREAQDFAAGWAGQYTPSWADTAGLVSHDIYQTITCPPGSGQCG